MASGTPRTGWPWSTTSARISILSLPNCTDYQFKQLCDTVPVTNANQHGSWKGEWWAYGRTMIYSHTQTPNRTSCAYGDIGLRVDDTAAPSP